MKTIIVPFLSTFFFLFFISSDFFQQKEQLSPGPLSKAHSFLEGAPNCGKCHSDEKKIEANRCLACHQPIAKRIEAKKGVHREVSGECEICHIEHRGFDVDLRPLDPKNFDHATETDFPLEGRHAALAESCPACHKTRSYLANQRNCGSCHADYHKGGLGRNCETCHTPVEWRNASRAFHKSGIFPLEGRHLTVACSSCHLNGQYKGTPARCYDCHWVRRQDDRYRTRLGNQCEECHRPLSWTAVSWNHGARTGMSLNPAHQSVACDACHRDGIFEQASFLCSSCHRKDYEKASEPNHVKAGFAMSCEECHLPSHTGWDQARFDHSAIFPLQGVHATLSCRTCHVNNVFRGTPRECYGCHRPNYEQAKDPNHLAAGFPTTCDSCHRVTDTSWNQASFNHVWFPITSGKHSDNTCSACHYDQANFKAFSCLTCHDRGSTDKKHSKVSGYVYNSQNCYSCHPQGKE